MFRRFFLLSALLSAAFAVQAKGGQGNSYGKNILSVAPIQMTNESETGIGFQYERFLNQRNTISLYLPVALSFFQEKNLDEAHRTYSYFYPGVKFYPGGNDRRLSYSLGTSFALGVGNRYLTDQHSSTNYVEEQLVKTGFIVNNGLNLQPTPAFYVGLELGTGILYYASSNASNVKYGEPMVQFQFKMGYRF